MHYVAQMLEIGAQDGRLYSLLALLGADVTGVDISEDSYRSPRMKFDSLPRRRT